MRKQCLVWSPTKGHSSREKIRNVVILQEGKAVVTKAHTTDALNRQCQLYNKRQKHIV